MVNIICYMLCGLLTAVFLSSFLVSIWLIKCYAAWCPACKSFVAGWRDTAKVRRKKGE